MKFFVHGDSGKADIVFKNFAFLGRKAGAQKPAAVFDKSMPFSERFQ